MEASLNNRPLHQIDATKTDFYNPVLKKLNNPEFKAALLNTQSNESLAKNILQNTQFDDAYRANLVSLIKAQYANSLINLKPTSAVAQNIEKLGDSNTLTVTTGQQIHIFLGPFFVVNKILSCCAEAKKYEEDLDGHDVVPIFWMASEDHDFDEIQTTRLYNEKYTWDIESNGPVGRLNPSSLLAIVAEAKERIDQSEENIEFLDICEFAYGNCPSFADATRYILHQYFEPEGIIIIDPDDSYLKSRCSKLFKADIFENSISKAIDNTISGMKGFGVKAPINTRPVNTFLISDTERNRIEKAGVNEYAVIGTSSSMTEAELHTKLKEQPEAFSPNALLRPLYQQGVLPNIHYVCGASEIMYWLELKESMITAGFNYPNLSIRKSLFFLSDKNIQKLASHEIQLSDLFIGEAALREKIVSKDNIVLADLEKEIDKNKASIHDLLKQFNLIELANLKKSEKIANQLFAELNSQHNAVVIKKSEHNVALNQVTKIKSNLYDLDYNQERNKYIISMIHQLKNAQNLFNLDYRHFLNHKTLALLSN